MYRCKRFSITVECIRYLRYFAVVFGMILAAAAFFLVLQILLLLLFQDVYLYGIFTFLNGALGLMILVLHSSSNQTVRAVLTKAWNQIVKKE